MIKFDHFNLLGPIYDRVLGRRKDQKILEFTEINSSHRVLDVGGGTGRIAELIEPFNADVIIADAAVKMLQEAQGKGMITVNAQSEKLPFDDKYFDRVMMVDALHHVKNQQQSMDEMWRVLAPNGKIIIEEPDIHHFIVKLVAFGEKLLLMRSHFLSPDSIAGLCGRYTSASVKIHRENGIAWIIITK